MNKRTIILYSLIFLGLAFLTLNMVLNSLTGKKIVELDFEKPFENDAPKEVIESIGKCTNRPIIEGLKGANDPHLKKLDYYQTVCDSFVTDRLMIFTDMPKDSIVAKSQAQELAKKLKLFNQFKITPIIIVEPVSQWGLIDFEEFKTGFYDAWIDDFFKELKNQGVTDEMMGIWVPFPEANLPYWNHSNADPKDFSAIVNKYLTILKKYFPGANASVLLNSATYDKDDFNWANGEYVSLQVYVKDIKKELVNSFGLQGFPWSPSADVSGTGIFDAREYLNLPLTTEAAGILGTSEIWFNTGSFSKKYTLDPQKTVYITPEKRKAVLDGIAEQAIEAKKKGYNIWVNLFSEDKSFTTEATDWSYASEEDKLIFASFVKKLNENNIPLALFDIGE